MVSLSTNYSLYSIPAMVVLAYYPAFKRSFIMTKLKAFNNLAPRSNVAKLQSVPNAKISPGLAAQLARMEGAHYNGLENLPFFGLSVLAANYAGVESATLNLAAGGFIVCRMIYNYIYLNQSTAAISRLRTLIWNISMIFPFYLSIKAAGVVSSK